MHFSYLLVGLMSCFAPCVAFPYANLAASPTTIRQTYRDGAYTEVECPPPKGEINNTVCEFRVGKKKKVRSYKLKLSDYGYNPYYAAERHYYFPNADSNSFDVSFEVPCNEADSKLLPGANQDYLECLIFLFDDATELKASRVQIIGAVDGNTKIADRVINAGH